MIIKLLTKIKKYPEIIIEFKLEIIDNNKIISILIDKINNLEIKVNNLELKIKIWNQKIKL